MSPILIELESGDVSFFRRERNWRTQRKTLGAKQEQQQTQLKHNRIRATFFGGECYPKGTSRLF